MSRTRPEVSRPALSLSESRPRLAVVGGGLAGLAAAAALSSRGYQVHLFEARRHWGGRAGSYREPGSDELIDHCQHVAMGCCTNFLELCSKLGVAEFLRRDGELYFVGPDGHPTRFTAARWLPTPLHLAPALAAIPYLSLKDKRGIGRAMWNLLRTPRESMDRVVGAPSGRWRAAAIMPPRGKTVAHWLAEQRQTPAAVERFWGVVLISALGESLERASFAAAHKVFLDGFLAARSASELWIPTIPLEDLYERMVARLKQQGVVLHLAAKIESVRPTVGVIASSDICHPAARDRTREAARDACESVHDAAPRSESLTPWQLRVGGDVEEFAGIILAVPWRRLEEMWGAPKDAPLPHVEVARSIASSPITAVHLWFDRPLFEMPHAVLVGRLSQWVFRRAGDGKFVHRDRSRELAAGDAHYYQVVISASRTLEGRSRESVRDEVLADLRALWPIVGEARLLRWRVVSQADAVFSLTPQLDAERPGQRTPYPRLAIAGDWTRTGWPSTMEGAVRSGYLAAEVLLEDLGEPARLLQPDLPRSLLTRLLRMGVPG